MSIGILSKYMHLLNYVGDGSLLDQKLTTGLKTLVHKWERFHRLLFYLPALVCLRMNIFILYVSNSEQVSQHTCC